MTLTGENIPIYGIRHYSPRIFKVLKVILLESLIIGVSLTVLGSSTITIEGV